ncbi:MAG: aspartate kinase [Candidatus Hodarchaeota archaeon]
MVKKKIIIMKIGGSCLTEAASLNKILKIMDMYKDANIVFVASGFSGVTDNLIEVAKLADKKDEIYKEKMKALKTLHDNINSSIFKDQVINLENTSDYINTCMRRLEEMCEQISDYGLEKFRLDFVMSFGEKLSTFIMSEFFTSKGFDSTYIPADQLVVTDDRFGNALPLMDFTLRKVKRQIVPIISRDAFPCVTGFIGITKEGYTTTLGRGGSDFTATILGAMIADLFPDAEVKVILWKNVDGILSTSPEYVDAPKLLEKLSYAEAKEIAYFGAKVLHPKCISPLEAHKVTLEIRNFDKPLGSKYTLINVEGDSSKIVKGISILKNVALLTAKSSGLVAIPGTLAKLFSVLGENHINVSLVSQSSSEVNTTLCVSQDDAQKALDVLKNSSMFDEWYEFTLAEDIVVISVIGSVSKSGLTHQVFEKLDEQNIEIIAIAQSADGLNISLVIKEGLEKKAISAIHTSHIF